MNKMIKKILMTGAIGVWTLTLVGCGASKESITVYNWGDYIDPEVNDLFTEETGIKVIYSEYANNEEMYATVEPGNVNYDILVPSDYMVEKMIHNGMLEKIDTTQLTNYMHIDEEFKNLPFDPDDSYSVPYMWGTVGIVYNTKLVDKPVDSWDVLWDEKYKEQIFMYDSERDSIMVALKKLGYSMNTRDEKELEEAKELLIQQAPLVLAYVGDEGKGKMVNEEAALMIAWAGDAMVMMDENPDLAYAIPKEGSNYFVDSIVIPKGSKNIAGAHQYIDFLCRPEIAARNAEYIGYSTPMSAAKELLPEEIKNSEVAYPPKEMLNDEKMEMFNDPSDVIELYSSLWTQVKASN
ncbi:MAG: transporter substrate-binding protein [Clostridia bacterium]|jgi:spermidine/putrescine-binding protein|nr:transporter substrate-binding protein [Clostridia bacterium]